MSVARGAVAAVLLLLASGAAAEEATPLDAPLVPGETMLIAAPLADTASPLLHYRLWIPPDYDRRPDSRYPVMFIAAPGGDADMGEMAARLKRERWLVAMLVESRNRSNAWMANFIAAHDDLLRRARVDEAMRFCTGLSGAAKVCSVFPRLRPGFRGMVLQAAGPWEPRLFAEAANSRTTVFGTFGSLDFNRGHSFRIRRGLPPTTRPMVEVWDGDHAWAPAAVFDRALDWLLAVALEDAAGDTALSEAYRWHIENRLADFARAGGDARRLAVADELETLARLAGALLDDGLRRRLRQAAEAVAGYAASEAGRREKAAEAEYRALLAREEANRGRELLTIADAYAALAESRAGTLAANLAEIRYRSLTWEMGRVPRPP